MNNKNKIKPIFSTFSCYFYLILVKIDVCSVKNQLDENKFDKNEKKKNLQK